jgi:SAM-dependent methyltransferase
MYETRSQETKKSAERIVELILSLYPETKSVVDVGCGTGIFLSTFQKHGVEKILGIDGDWMPLEMLEIERDFFMVADLTTSHPNTLQRFDLALCLEVAEHLSINSAENLVNILVNFSDEIIFSAAIPGQGGNGHVNEQWQSYWVDKFAKHNYYCHDLLRKEIWNDPGVLPWYKQNILIFNKFENHSGGPINIVHPDVYRKKIQKANKKGILLALIPDSKMKQSVLRLYKAFF